MVLVSTSSTICTSQWLSGCSRWRQLVSCPWLGQSRVYRKSKTSKTLHRFETIYTPLDSSLCDFDCSPCIVLWLDNILQCLPYPLLLPKLDAKLLSSPGVWLVSPPDHHSYRRGWSLGSELSWGSGCPIVKPTIINQLGINNTLVLPYKMSIGWKRNN